MFQYTFMQNAFIVSFFISILCPIIGLFLVLRKQSLIGDTLSHSSLAGVTLALISGLNPILGAFIFTSLAGALIEVLRNWFKEYGDLILSIVLSLSVGIAITLISAGVVKANAETYLFGSILTVSSADVITVIVLSFLSLICLFFMYHKMLYIALDEDIAKIANIRVKTINYIFSVLVAATISVSIKIVGMLVLTSMIALPAAAALQLKTGFKKTLIASILFSISDIMLGLILSYHLNVAPGGFTALVSVAVLVVTIGIKRILR
ncbi:metal ABC transporter permease [Treponema pedis]|uniref:Metal ABC transporter permease n=1 Tax=Treponema pedis TaxID=409322 RepID=A0A7S6WP60_9SPIR|nr:metal ABC transporter permease [Treponema pedis]QOW60687.1 metal ABC transporter permease [Treponema pedis]QSI03962.1 metal ABC transporter permease [Treponema pedis]